MDLFVRLRTLADDMTLERCKLHLATRHGASDPLALYGNDEFDEWQSYQSKRNFTRPLVIALIRKQEPDRWLFAGVYQVCDKRELDDHVARRRAHEQSEQWGLPATWEPKFIYQMRRRCAFGELEGLTVTFRQPPGRNPYRLADKLPWMPEVHGDPDSSLDPGILGSWILDPHGPRGTVESRSHCGYHVGNAKRWVVLNHL